MCPDPTAIPRRQRGEPSGKVPPHRRRPGQAVEEGQRTPRELPVECLSHFLNLNTTFSWYTCFIAKNNKWVSPSLKTSHESNIFILGAAVSHESVDFTLPITLSLISLIRG